LDQFPRNMFRGTPQAFAEDAAAQRLCLEGLEQGLDAQLSPVERGFFCMPLQHAEIPHLQDISVQQYERLLRECEPEWKPLVRGMLKYAREHRSEEHTSELQSREKLVCRLLLEKKKRRS